MRAQPPYPRPKLHTSRKRQLQQKTESVWRGPDASDDIDTFQKAVRYSRLQLRILAMSLNWASDETPHRLVHENKSQNRQSSLCVHCHFQEQGIQEMYFLGIPCFLWCCAMVSLLTNAGRIPSPGRGLRIPKSVSPGCASALKRTIFPISIVSKASQIGLITCAPSGESVGTSRTSDQVTRSSVPFQTAAGISFIFLRIN
jgi:hypothetical protein